MRQIIWVAVTLVAATLATPARAAGTSPLDTLASTAASDARAQVALGDLLVEARRIDEARQAYARALELQPGFGEAELGKVRIDMANNKFEPAKTACRAIARRNATTAVGEVCSGWFWISYDRSARAVEEFQKAVDKGDRARGLTGLGEAARRQGEADKAVGYYRDALAAGADYLADLGLGLALELKGDRQAALVALRAAVQKQPASCLAHYNLGRVLGVGPEAVGELEQALAIRVGWPEALQALGAAHLAAKNWVGAEAAYRQAVASEQGRGQAFAGLGQALYGLGRKEEALSAMTKALEIVPNMAEAHLLVADILYETNQVDAAVEALERARSASPGTARVQLRAGELMLRLNRHTTAKSYLEQAVTIQANLSRAHQLLGDIACLRRLYDSGQAAYAAALAGDMVDVDRAAVEKAKAACVPRR